MNFVGFSKNVITENVFQCLDCFIYFRSKRTPITALLYEFYAWKIMVVLLVQMFCI